MTGPVDHLGEDLTALVDGELAHDARDRALAHLAHCAPCREEAERQRRLKARLLGLAGPPVPTDLAARLLAVPERWAPASAGPLATPRPGPTRPAVPSRSRGPAGRPARAAGPGRARRSRAPRLLAGGVAAVVGLGVVLALGGPRGGTAPVDPGSPAFVVDFVTTTSEIPLMDPVGGVVTAGVTGGGDR